MTTKISLIPIAVVMLVTATAFACFKPKERTVTYKRMAVGDYQNFLKNWDEKQQAVLYALIQTPTQYDALFQPAAAMGSKLPFAPAAELYAKEQILVVARVMAAPEDINKVFEVERVAEKDQELALYYRFNESTAGASFSIKSCLAVRIPRRHYKKVIFMENGKPVGELNTAAGEWSVPAMTAEPNSTEAGNDQ